MKRFIFTVTAILFFVQSSQAQTVTKTLSWDEVGVSLATVQTYTASLVIDSAIAVQLAPVCITNATTPANVTCTSPITLTAGNHTITITETDGNGSSSGTLNYVAPATAVAPTNIKIIINITVP